MPKVKRFCEYKLCQCRHKKMPPFKPGNNDRKCRFLHKQCYKDWAEIHSFDLEVIDENPLNIKYERCIANKNGTNEQCRCTVNTDKFFDTKTGYCKYHNYTRYHVMYG